ncbi:MAG: sn-glycerol-3-phosphate ABC transporter permease UgpE [Deltaproteobacteria bacterium]|jgi:sn-glycerol 3-phosphate transport system permease protein|nr:sn-glycerol-3-phosphate ABC transporter permease UgpE [Deltaproteobacteria bacterium]
MKASNSAVPKEKFDWTKVGIHLFLIIAVLLICFPLYYAFVLSTQTMEEVMVTPQKLLPSSHLLDNYIKIWNRINMGQLLFNSAVLALATSLGKIAISILSAFAIVYFNFRGKQIVFWMIFLTLMLPVPVRIISTYQVISELGWVDTYMGLIIPLIASATATFLFRQFYLTIPDELVDAAKIDGSGPLRFLWSVLLPNSGPSIAALFVVMFIYGWNQYLWPLMATNSEKMKVVVVGIASTIPTGTQPPEWNLVMAVAMMALIPPVLVVLFMQRWFMHGLLETEK